MFELRHGECPAGRLEDEHGYVETDPSGRYGRFQDVLGRGATKVVYRAFDELHGMEVAWNQAKICDVMQSPEALERLYSEVNLLSLLRHDSIIRFHISWVDAGKRTFNFITEMFTSGTLREYRQRYRCVDIRAVKNWAGQILRGLVYLHGHDPPVIHRDLKCDNIFVNGHLGQVKIGDLGLAAFLRGSQSAHSVIGTPEFMAPELYEEDYNELVDIYSFGMCVLEMLTADYPYSECSNPAQIYKKVTSGKLPDAFYQVQDPEAGRFIGRCLENASKRPTARELLRDPFLSFDGSDSNPKSIFKSLNCKASYNGTAVNEDQEHLHSPVARDKHTARSSDMRITGKMNREDDTIFLRVQFANKDGNGSNIYFPFDIISDTPMDVANEMVKELEITNRDPSEIAEVISQEISALVPNWKERALPPPHNFTYGEEDGVHHPSYYSSSPSSSHGSFYSQAFLQAPCVSDWLRNGVFPKDDDASSENSIYSEAYSNVMYISGGEQDQDPCTQRREFQPSQQDQRTSRFCPEESSRLSDNFLAGNLHKKCNVTPDSPRASGDGGKRAAHDERRKLTRNRSLVNMQSQLLHRSLVEEVKKRLFKTVGAVENIGFQMPCEASGKGSSSFLGTSKKGGFTRGRN